MRVHTPMPEIPLWLGSSADIPGTRPCLAPSLALGLGLVKPNPPGQYHVAPDPTMVDLRWAAAVAGYPSPPLEYLSGRVEAGAFPEGLQSSFESWLKPGDDLGLVRLRKGTEDLWLATRAKSLHRFFHRSVESF